MVIALSIRSFYCYFTIPSPGQSRKDRGPVTICVWGTHRPPALHRTRGSWALGPKGLALKPPLTFWAALISLVSSCVKVRRLIGLSQMLH